MPSIDKQQYDVLNAVALKKSAPAGAVAASTAIDEGAAAAAFADLEERQLLVVVGGSAMPTDEAGGVLDDSAAEFYAETRRDADLLELVDRFEDVNTAFLDATSSWQQVKVGDRQVTNDHSDPDYDEKVIGRINKLVQRLAPLLDAFAGHDPRFSTYRQRFDTALDEVDRGSTDYVSSPTVESVHNIWFEFHEDLLRTLGRERRA